MSSSAGAWLKGQSSVATARVMRTALWALVGLGAAGGIWGAVRPAPKAPVVKFPELTTGQEGVAQMYVATWLRGGGRTGTGIDAYYPALVATDPLSELNAPPPVNVLRVAAIEPRIISPGYVAVTVAADLVETDGSVSTHFYRADVLKIDRNADGSPRTPTYVAPALPFEVPAPLGARLPSLDVGRPLEIGPTDPMGNRVSRFLTALLTGSGEVNDYTAPGANIRPVRPAPFASVQTSTISSSPVAGPVKTVDVLVSVIGVDRAGRQFPMTYPLELTQRANRWEVAKLMQAPVLASSQPNLIPATTAVPATTTTLPVPSTTTTAANRTTSTTATTTTTRQSGR